MVLDTGSAETVVIPEVLDELGYSARNADRVTVMRSAVGREEGYLIHDLLVPQLEHTSAILSAPR